MKKRERIRRTFRIHQLILVFFLLNLAFPLRSQERYRKSPPFPEPLKELKLPDLESASLSNGLEITVIQRVNFPLMSLQLIILAGESSSPENIPGLATFTANMLTKGAADLSSSEIEDIIEYIGGNISISTFLDYSLFSFSFLEEYLDEALDVLSKMILRPTFIRREIDNERRNMFYELREKEKDPEFVAERQLLQILFQGHPYQRAIYSENIVKGITQKDILAFYNNYYRPNNSELVITGNLNLNTASRKVSHYLNTWKNSDVKRPSIQPLNPSTKKRICLVDLPRAKDSTIYIGNVISPLTTQDFFPFLVLNQVLGGTPSSRLFMNLRETKGYAYFAFSEVGIFKNCGVFMVKAKVRPEVTHPSVEESLDEIEKMVKEEITSFEIEQAKSYLIGNFPIKIKNFGGFSLNISKVIALNLGDSYWNKYYENIMLINAERVFDVAQKYPLNAPVVVIVADKNRIIDYLSDFREIEVYNNKGVLQYTSSKGVEK